jgi:hypothetical protein
MTTSFFKSQVKQTLSVILVGLPQAELSTSPLLDFKGLVEVQ